MGIDPQYQSYPPTPVARASRRNRTRTGILIMAIGLLLDAIPDVGTYLSILVLVGLGIVVSRSSEISRTHHRMAMISLLLLIVAIAVEVVAVIRYYALIGIVSGATSLSFAVIVKYMDPFLFLVAIVYAVMSASLLLSVFSLFPKKGRVLLFVIYVVAFLIMALGIFSSMNRLNGLYYQNVTFSNISSFTSVVNGLSAYVAGFLVLWAIAYFITYFGMGRTREPVPSRFAPSSDSYESSATPRSAMNTQQQPEQYQQNFNASQSPPNVSLQQQNGIVCPSCGTINLPGSKFCSKCGNSLGTSQSGSSTLGFTPRSALQSSSENIVFVHAGATLVSIDNKKVSVPPFSGTIMISDSRFMFLSRGKGSTVAVSLGGSLTYGLISRTTTTVDTDQISRYLVSRGSFELPIQDIRDINASPSRVLHGGKIILNSLKEVAPNETNVQGSSAIFVFMARGSPGGTILKDEEANYLNSKINAIIRSKR